MFKKAVYYFVAFRDAHKIPFDNFTSAWLGKSSAVLKKEKFDLTVWVIFGFLFTGAAITFRSPNSPIPKVVSDIISLDLYGCLLFSGVTISLIPLLIRKNMLQLLIDIGNVLMKGALHGSALLMGVLLSILIVGGSSNHEKPDWFFFIFSVGVVYTAILMIYTIFGLSFSETYKTFQPKLSHKVWLFSLFLLCLLFTYYIAKQ